MTTNDTHAADPNYQQRMTSWDYGFSNGRNGVPPQPETTYADLCSLWPDRVISRFMHDTAYANGYAAGAQAR